MENNKNKKFVKFQGDMLKFCDFIQVFVFTRNHHLKNMYLHVPSYQKLSERKLGVYYRIFICCYFAFLIPVRGKTPMKVSHLVLIFCKSEL